MKQLNIGSEGAGESGPPSTLEGVLDRVTFENPENGWSVVRVRLDGEGKPRTITAVGHLPGAQPGETLRLTGSWITDRKWGEQFRVESFLTVQPATLIGMERYLGSGMVEGIGPELARRLVEHFGLEAFEVIEQHPRRLTEVEGIGPKRKTQILEAWQAQKGIKDVMVFLQAHGVSTAFAVKVFKRYGEHAIALLKENPYRLSVDIYGVGFRTADRIALDLGLPANSTQRAAAGLLHVLDELAGEGHMFCPGEALLERAGELLEVDLDILQESLAQLVDEGEPLHPARAATRAEDRRTAVAEDTEHGKIYYLAWLYAAEVGAARLLRKVLDAPPRVTRDGEAPDGEEAIAWVEARGGVELAAQQREAVLESMGGRSLVITGGPGTGKTTIVRAVLDLVDRAGRRALLCAPTGRAAKRLGEATGREASTVHRLLDFDPRQRRFLKDEEDPLDADLLIVDEVSMVDASLFHAILKATPPGFQLVLVGDVDQLPSVGPGNVLRELIRSGAVPVVRLTEIFRQAAESLIVVNAHRVNSGEVPQLAGRDADSDFYFIERDQPEEILATLEEIVCRRIPRRFGADAVEQIQVLTPMHRGLLGSINLNQQLQQALNPHGRTVTRGGRQFRVGDKVMQIRNNYDLEVFNGDIGRVLALDEEQRKVTVQFDDRPVPYEPSDLDELVLGYACSIHKSQGSEYPVVVIPLHTQHYTMLQRNLLYTAITRGRRLVVLVGSKKAVGIAVRNRRVVERFTGLARRLSARPRA